MELICRCGNPCVKPALDVLKNIELLHEPCDSCESWILKKFPPLKDQIDLDAVAKDWGRCECGKRHLDVVIAHVLKIMMDERLKDEKSNLRNACIPLITPAYPTNSVPYLEENSLVILSDEMDKICAERILEQVPEVKGILKGNLRSIVGIKDADSTYNVYELLAGCDMRCDIIQNPFGPICIYKYQGKIHIEFPRLESPKIEKISKILEKYNSPTVIDCTCGPGTLGIACLKAGAKKVVFNDLWYPATELTALNLEVNGFSVDFLGHESGLIAYGDNFEVYCMDIRELETFLDEKYDICIVDVFPGVDSEEFVEAAGKLGEEVVVI